MDVVAEKKIGIASLAVNSLSLLFNIIALAISTWISVSYEAGSYSSSTSMGLWKYCTETKNYRSQCVSLISVEGYLAATRAMMILGMLLILAAAVCAVMKLFVKKEQERLPKLAGATAIVSGIFMLIGAIVFAAESSGGATGNLGAGFGLAIVSALLAILAGVGYLVAEKQKQI